MSFFSDDEDDLMDLAKFDSMVETAAALRRRRQKEEDEEEERGVVVVDDDESAADAKRTTRRRAKRLCRLWGSRCTHFEFKRAGDDEATIDRADVCNDDDGYY